MSRVLTFSTKFPAYHPKKGEQIFFREKIWAALADKLPQFQIPGNCTDWDWHEYYNAIPKWHTIRAGNRWKVGDKFSPRVWSGKPYQSKQIIIAPDIEVKNVWDIEILFEQNQIHFGKPNGENQWLLLSAGDVAKNDGLSVHDFYNWFDTPKNRKQKVVKAKIICWNENIIY